MRELDGSYATPGVLHVPDPLRRFVSGALASLIVLAAASALLSAGGPRLVSPDGLPVTWDADQPVAFAIDDGPLGPLDREEAAAAIRRALQSWEAIPASSVTFSEHGRLPEDVGADNFDAYLAGDTGANPLIFDHDGSLLDRLLGVGAADTVLGLSDVSRVDLERARLLSAWIVFNGRLLGRDSLERVALHEIGHLLGLDHTQAARDLAENGSTADDGLVPIMYPFILPHGTLMPRADDAAWLSWMYPGVGSGLEFAYLSGSVLTAAGAPLPAVNVVAVPVSGGREEAAESVSALSGVLEPGSGDFLIPFPAGGEVHLYIEPLDVRFRGVSLIGHSEPGYAPFPRDYYNGEGESGSSLDSPTERVALALTPAETLSGIEMRVNDPHGDLVFPASFDPRPSRGVETFVGVALFNPATTHSAVEIEAFDADGELEAEAETPLEPGAQRAFLTREVIPSGREAAMVRARAEQTPVQGFFMLGDVDLARLDGIGGELAASPSLHFTIATPGVEDRVTLFVFNPDEHEAAAAVASLNDTVGRLVAEVPLTFAPSASISVSLEELFGAGVSVDQGSVRIEADRPLQGFQVLTGPDTHSCLAAQVARPVGRLLAPHFFLSPAGGGSRIRLLNADADPVVLELKARDARGGPIAGKLIRLQPGQLFAWDLGPLLGLHPETLPETLTGYLEIGVNPGTGRRAAVVGSIEFRAKRGQVSSTLALSSGGSAGSRFLHVAQSRAAGIFTGLASLNPGPETARVRIAVHDQQGRPAAEREISIAPGHRLMDLLDGEQLFGPGFEQVSGHIEVTSSQPLVSFALFGDFQSRFLSAIEARVGVR